MKNPPQRRRVEERRGGAEAVSGTDRVRFEPGPPTETSVFSVGKRAMESVLPGPCEN